MIRPAPLYACHNKPREVPTYLAQDGYFPPIERGMGYWHRTARYVEVPHVMSTDCRYDRAQSDSRCSGCRAKPSSQ